MAVATEVIGDASEGLKSAEPKIVTGIRSRIERFLSAMGYLMK